MISSVIEIGEVSIPAWKGDQFYMVPFKKGETPPGMVRFADAILNMTRGIEFTDGFVTVDQSCVLKNRTQRRPGVHVDGNWDGIRYGGGGGHIREGSEQLLVLASDAIGCDVTLGEFLAPEEFDGGNCEGVAVNGRVGLRTRPSVAYAGGACSMLHASAPVEQDCQRTLIRLNLNGWRA